MNKYGGGKLPLYHFDMYRIDAKQALDLGFREIFEEKDAVCLVEWPENVAGLLPKKTVSIEIKRTGELENERIISLTHNA
jgi:tRNA threonylcarbamoyladenosine biosynthesis protein TsaE